MNSKLRIKQLQRGFSITEIVIVIGIIAILFTFGTLNLARFQNSTTIASLSDEVVAVMKQQQGKAMAGAVDTGGNTQEYGIHFDADQYVLFVGTTYSPTATSNSFYALDDGSSFTNITFPDGNLIFSRMSGEVVGYDQARATVTLSHGGGTEQRVIRINRYGVVEEVQ